jgi:phosphohistidine swiveling domain-containing protein
VIAFNEREWTPWEQPASPLLLVLTLNASIRPLRDYFGAPIFTTVVHFTAADDGPTTGKWLFRMPEGLDLGRRMVDYLLCTPYRVAFDASLAEAEARLTQDAGSVRRLDLGTLQGDELVEAFRRLEAAFHAYYTFGAFVEPVQWRTEEVLHGYLERAGVSDADALGVLFTPPEDPYVVDVLRDLVECAHLFEAHQAAHPGLAPTAADGDLGDGPDAVALRDALQRHVDAFGWKRNNYLETQTLTADDVLLEIQEPARLREQLDAADINATDQRARRAALVAEMPAYERGVAELASSVGSGLGDSRKRMVQIANAAFDRIVAEIASRAGFDSADVRLLVPQEIEAFVADPESMRAILEARRVQMVVGHAPNRVDDDALALVSLGGDPGSVTGSDPFVAEGDDVPVLLASLDARLDLLDERPAEALLTAGELLRGDVAYASSALTLTAPARVVRDPLGEQVESGEILVATSTTPDFMFSLERCAAIVTEWGSQASHAALMARQLAKPCLIGVRGASYRITTGMRLRLDLGEGTVGLDSDGGSDGDR